MSLPRLEFRAGQDLLNEFGLTTETVADALDAVAQGGSVSAADISKAKALLVRSQTAPTESASEGRCNALALKRKEPVIRRSAKMQAKQASRSVNPRRPGGVPTSPDAALGPRYDRSNIHTAAAAKVGAAGRSPALRCC